jgi:hypothetical protein
MKAGMHVIMILALIILSNPVTGQEKDTLHLVYERRTESTPDSIVLKRNFGKAIVRQFIANAIPFSVNYFIRNQEFSKVDFGSIRNNLSLKSLQWDSDPFFNNQFSHPYHGSFYFNAFRAEGYSFWSAAPATFAGSVIWELAGEKDRPSSNDLINTTLGGMVFGEMTHRLSSRVITDPSNNKNSFLHIVGLLIDPMNALTYSKKNKLRSALFRDTTVTQMSLTAGSRKYRPGDIKSLVPGWDQWFTRLSIIYGDRFSQVKHPFDYFSFQLELGSASPSLLNTAHISGALTGRSFLVSSRTRFAILLLLDYDYFQNPGISYGMQSFHWGQLIQYAFNSENRVEAGVNIVLIPLAAITDGSVYEPGKRAYDYGSGTGVAFSASLLVKNRLKLNSTWRSGIINTIDGKSLEYKLTHFTYGLQLNLIKNVGLFYEWNHYSARSKNKNEIPGNTVYLSRRFAFTYSFQL